MASSQATGKTPSGKPIGPRERRIAILGARSVGKSCLALQFVESHFIESYYPTIDNTFTKPIKVQGTDYQLEIHDTAGQDEYSILGSKQAVGLHGWVLVYSVVSRRSFEVLPSIREKILTYTGLENAPVLVVGNKSDLEMHRQVSVEEGKELAKEWNCPFIEASARDGSNVEKIFELAVIEVQKSIEPKVEASSSKCIIL